MELTRQERAQLYHRQHWRLPADIPLCANCEHYCQHYIKGGPPIFEISMVPLDSGHCTFPRGKARKAYDTCEYFANKHIHTEP